MPYERSRRIEQRFRRTVTLIQEGCGSAADLAASLNVSRPTIHRIIAELKRRGYDIRSVHEGNVWRYDITGTPSTEENGAGR